MRVIRSYNSQRLIFFQRAANSDFLPHLQNFIQECRKQDNYCKCKHFHSSKKNTQFCRIKGCGGAGCPPPPPPIIFERLKLPQQIIYRRKGNLSESPNHQKYWENVLILRFYEQFSRNSRILGHFWKFEKISNS